MFWFPAHQRQNCRPKARRVDDSSARMTKGSDTDVWTSDSRPVAASLLRACTSACRNQVVNARFDAIGSVYPLGARSAFALQICATKRKAERANRINRMALALGPALSGEAAVDSARRPPKGRRVASWNCACFRIRFPECPYIESMLDQAGEGSVDNDETLIGVRVTTNETVHTLPDC